MNINSLSNSSFGTCVPIRLAVYTDKNGEHGFVPDEKVAGLTTALVKRLKNPNSAEAAFLSKHIEGFNTAQEYDTATETFSHKVCSTAGGNTDAFIKKEGNLTHLIFGDDENYVKWLQKRLRLGKIDIDTLVSRICQHIIKPQNNRGVDKYSNQKVALTLHSDMRGDNYRLNGITITTIDGDVLATLAPKKTSNVTQKINAELLEDNFSECDAYEEYLKERAIEDAQKRVEEEQNLPDLLADDEFYDRED